MDLKLDYRVAELLFSRFCHDLVGPVGATVNGVELIEEMGMSSAGDALSLLSSSARIASKRLRVYRIAYGVAAGAALNSFQDAEALIRDFLDGDKVTITWLNANDVAGLDPNRWTFKLILNILLCAKEALPRGGAVTFSVKPGASPAHMIVTAKGSGAKLGHGMNEAINHKADINSLDPRTVQPWFTAWLGQYLNASLQTTESTDQVTFEFVIPQGTLA